MNKIIKLIVPVVFILTLMCFKISSGEDVTLTSDGRVPFEALQQQIDDLQMQIDAMQDYQVKAYVTKAHDVMMSPDTYENIMTMSLPKGKFINTLTVEAGTSPPGTNDTPISGLGCTFVDNQNNPITGDGFGGHVISHQSFAITLELEFWDEGPTDVTVRCHSMELNDSNMDIIIYSAKWTAIKVDNLERQNILP